jgi:drug/metabolite transporter (DMT)-like permease
VTERRDVDQPVPASSGVRRSARISGSVAVVALVAAVVLYAAGGPPYGVNIGGGVLYLLGLLAGLVASVLLWLSWAERREHVSPQRLRWGVGTALGSLLAVCATTVISLSHVASGTTQLVLMGVTAAVLVAALLLTGEERRAR